MAFLALAPDAWAQVLYGTLTGTVSDQSGAAVPSAKVEALNVGTGVARSTTTDDRGNLHFLRIFSPAHIR